eukprot:484814_1
MPLTLFEPIDKSLPTFVLPDYDNIGSFYPFSRLPEPFGYYEKLKTLIISIILLPFRIFSLITTLIFATILAQIAIINYPSNTLKDLTKPWSLWRGIMFRMIRFGAQLHLFSLGTIKSWTYYSYKDMQQKFGYKLPSDYKLKYDKNGNEIHEKCRILVCNHSGWMDILCLMFHFNASFLSKKAIKNVFGIGKICESFQSLFIEKGKSSATILLNRVQFDYKYHHNKSITCTGCSLCLTNMTTFPEGTTTNGDDLLMFRRGVFNAGLPIIPIVIKQPWKQFNPTWDTIFFLPLIWRTCSQLFNRMEIYVAPPYIPSEKEKKDSALYAYNVSILMATMYGKNRLGKVPRIWLMNRAMKSEFHKHVVQGADVDVVCNNCKLLADSDTLIQKYIGFIEKDARYKEKQRKQPIDGLGKNEFLCWLYPKFKWLRSSHNGWK